MLIGMATLTPQQPTPAGFIPTFTPASNGGDNWLNTGKEYIVVHNGSGVSVAATILSHRLCDQGFQHDITKSIAAGAEAWLGPFDSARFADSSGYVAVSITPTTSVTVALLQEPT
jgi:hypothetical protein